MSKTSIEWTDRSINPIRARRKDGTATGHYCERVSPGCANCYSSNFQPRFHMPTFGGKAKVKPVPGVRGVSVSDEIEVFLDEARLREVLKARIPAKWFWCDMSDLFGEWVPTAWIDQCVATMIFAKRHTHQLLTKRAERADQYWNDPALPTRLNKILNPMERLGGFQVNIDTDISNIWMGVSVENQPEAMRVVHLLRCPHKVKFISQEPQLEAIDYDKVPCEFDDAGGHNPGVLSGIDWLIQGGESGNHLKAIRPFNIAWARQTRDQCRAAGVAYFLKQLGRKPEQPEGCGDCDPCRAGHPCPLGYPLAMKLNNPKGGDMSEWPEDLRVREMPEVWA